MIYATSEAGDLSSPGIHFYPWSERKYSLGFRLSWQWRGMFHVAMVRWSVRCRRFFWYHGSKERKWGAEV
jgi:hypothetical protein